jgi:hypothetical protein
MELVPYENFAKLRLRDFAPANAEIGDVTDWEWQGGMWLNEGIGFTSFSRLAEMPDETGGLEISFSQLPAEANEKILRAIGLPLSAGMSVDQVFALLGSSDKTYSFVPDRKTFEFTVGDAQSYSVSCTVDDNDGLVYVTVVRGDVLEVIAKQQQ